MFIMICRQHLWTQDQHLPVSITDTTTASPKEKKKVTKPLGALDPSKTRKRCYRNLLDDLTHTDILGNQDFVRMPPTFLTSLKNAYTTIKKTVTNIQEALKSWSETGNNVETPVNRRNLHLLAVSLAGWPNHHLQICSPDLPIHL